MFLVNGPRRSGRSGGRGGLDVTQQSFDTFDRGGQMGPPRSNDFFFGAADDTRTADDSPAGRPAERPAERPTERPAEH